MLPATDRAFAGCFQPLPTEYLFLTWVVEFQEVRDTTSIPRHGRGARPVGLFFGGGRIIQCFFNGIWSNVLLLRHSSPPAPETVATATP